MYEYVHIHMHRDAHIFTLLILCLTFKIIVWVEMLQMLFLVVLSYAVSTVNVIKVDTRKAIYIVKSCMYKKLGKIKEPQNFRNRRGDLSVRHSRDLSQISLWI